MSSTSQKRIDANRANALKSTGPTSPAGRAKSRLNAVRDGLTGQVITLSDEERPIFEKLKAEYLAALKPADLEEHKLAHAIAWDTWRLDRLRATEMNMYALGDVPEVQSAGPGTPDSEPGFEPDSDPDPDGHLLETALASARTFRAESKRFERMSLYEQRLTRSLHRNRAALRELQAERQRRYEQDRKEEVLLARLEDLKDSRYESTGAPTPNGFVFSSDEINSRARRERNLEAAIFLLNNKMPWEKYGATGAGSPDLFANIPYHRPPDCIPPKIHGVSPESIALRKYYHPEEFEKRRH